MSIVGLLFYAISTVGDWKKKNQAIPADIIAYRDLSYTGGKSRYERLDVYAPANVKGKLPVILNVHGGGWVYGHKEVYRPYCCFLAHQGFTVVNMNYHLAPGRKFPTQLGQINQALCWLLEHAEQYDLDTDKFFLAGDSAGAQMASQYAAILTNPKYAALFPFALPKGLRLRAVGLNCGTYEIRPASKRRRKFCFTLSREAGSRFLQSEDAMNGLMDGLMKDYLGRDTERLLPMLDVKGNLSAAFPPAFLMTTYYDFVKAQAQPMCELLQSHGVEAVCRCYGGEGDTHMTHVCHTDMSIPEARQMNMDELAFFRKQMGESNDDE